MYFLNVTKHLKRLILSTLYTMWMKKELTENESKQTFMWAVRNAVQEPQTEVEIQTVFQGRQRWEQGYIKVEC